MQKYFHIIYFWERANRFSMADPDPETPDPLKLAVAEQNMAEAQLETWLSQGDSRAVAVVKKQRCVSQETFDAAVRENIDEFEMEVQEAVDDAKTQFELQGVGCDDIVADVARY